MKAYHMSIHLASHEWGNELMRQVAMQTFAEHPLIDPLVVEVYEHAGWYLTYNRQGRIVGTANDSAAFPAETRAFLETLRGAQWIYLPSIRRPDLAPVEAA